MSNNDTEHILEAIDALSQQMTNLEKEMCGLREDVQQMAIGEDIAKKKWTPSSASYMTPWLNWSSCVPGESPRRNGRHW